MLSSPCGAVVQCWYAVPVGEVVLPRLCREKLRLGYGIKRLCGRDAFQYRGRNCRSTEKDQGVT
nr:MAG TPA: hypothetical protein [Caudoviricetes sp.]